MNGLWLRVEHARLRLLRGFEELMCLEGLHGVERLPHQIETVRRVLRHFRDGVGLRIRLFRRQRTEESVGLVHDADYLAAVAGGAELSD